MKPNVKLISVSDNRESAWKFSRPGFDHSELDMNAIGGMDMSLNSLCMLTFEVHSSLIFRDWMFSIRPIFPWARSSRSAPLTSDNSQISAEFGSIGAERVQMVLEAIEKGVPQDKAREGLPMSMATAYTVTMDLRTCIGMVKAMEELDDSMYQIYGKRFNSAMSKISGAKNSSVKSFKEQYMLIPEEFGMTGATNMGKTMIGFYDMKSALMAQFLRMSHASVRTSIWNEINDSGYINMGHRSQDDNFKVAFSCDIEAYHKLMVLRSHWFADWSDDMWGNIVGDYIEGMDTETFWNFIPNGNGKKDPYHRDMISRITGEEHNLPCPIMTECPSLVEQRYKDLGDNKIIQMYLRLCRLGYIDNNPDNKLRKQYESLEDNK